MKKMLIVGAVIVPTLLIGYWATTPARVTVSDVRNSELLTIKTEAKSNFVHALSINVEGWIDGEAEIALLLDEHLNEHPSRVEKLHGKVAFHWGGNGTPTLPKSAINP